MRLKPRLFVASLAAVMTVSAFAQSSPSSAELKHPVSLSSAAKARADMEIAELVAKKALRTPAQQKIDSALLDTLTMWHGERITKSIAKLDTGITPDKDGYVIVDIDAVVTNDLLSNIRFLGGTVVSSFPQYKAVRAFVSLDALEQIAVLPGVRYIEREQKSSTSTGSVTSKGDAAHTASNVRASIGTTGAGVGVGVISNGIASLATSKSTGDLPASVYVVPGQSGSGDEGTAMMEIVYDLAPGSPLAFSTANGGQAQFAANITALHNAGYKVIVDDVFYYAEAAFQDGVIAQAAESHATTGGFYFSSAGNEGRLSANTSGVHQADYADNGSGYHIFSGTDSYCQMAGTVAVTLQWSDPLAASANDYDLYIVDGGGNVTSSSTGSQTGTQDPYEQASGASSRWCRIRKYSGSDRYVRLNAIRGYLAYPTTGQTWGHSSAPHAFSIAAVDASGTTGPFTTANGPESFTSNGPRKMFFNANGTAITPGNFSSTGGSTRNKPDFTAADGVQTTVPGFQPFYGTSAAAPHAAAIAALMIQQYPNMIYSDLQFLMTDTALDLQTSGWDVDTGAGTIMADAACRYLNGYLYKTLGIDKSLLPVGVTSTATIGLLVPAPPSGTTFTITSNGPGLSLPATVTAPAGATSVSFPVLATSGSNTSVTVKVAMDYSLGIYGTFTIDIKKPAPISIVFPNNGQAQGGFPTTGTVTLSAPAEAGGQKVLLKSSNPNVVVPAFMKVAVGQTTGTFSVTPSVVPDKISSKITGTANSRAVFTYLVVLPVQITNLVVNPTHVTGGSTSTATVTLDAPAPAGGVVITLTSDDASATVPATITIAAGNTTKNFPVHTTSVAVTKTVQLKASRAGSGKAVRNLRIDP